MNRLWLLWGILLSACGGGASEKKQPPGDTPLAIVGQDTITLAEYRLHLGGIDRNKIDLSDPLQRQGLLNELIHRRLILLDGLKRSLDTLRVVQLAAQERTDEILFEKLLLQIVYPGGITDDEIQNYYRHLHREVRLSHILLAHERSKPMASDEPAYRSEAEAKRLSDSLYTELIMDPNKMSRFAMEFSDDTNTKFVDGDLGYVRWGQTTSDIDEGVLSLDSGNIARPVSSPRGIHIFKVKAQRLVSLKPLDEIRSEVVGMMVRTRLARKDKTLEERKRTFLDSLTITANFTAEENNIRLFLKKYGTIDHAHDITEAFAAGERDLVLARFNGGRILVGDLVNAMSRNRKKVDLDRKSTIDGLRRVAEIRLGAEAARRSGLTLSPYEQNEIREIQIDQMGVVLLTETFDRMELSDEKVRAYYEGNLSRYRGVSNIRVSQLISADQAQMNAYFGEMRQAGFNAVFEKARKEGKVQAVTVGPIPANRQDEITIQTTRMKPGDYSTPFKLASGAICIVHLDEKIPGEVYPFNSIKDQVEHDALHFYRQVSRDDWFGRLAEEYKVIRFPENLNLAFDIKID